MLSGFFNRTLSLNDKKYSKTDRNQSYENLDFSKIFFHIIFLFGDIFNERNTTVSKYRTGGKVQPVSYGNPVTYIVGSRGASQLGGLF